MRTQRAIRVLVLASCALVTCLVLTPSPAGAQTGTLFVEGDAVGIGTDTPGATSGVGGVPAKLHLKTTTGSDGALLVENASGTTAQRVLFELKNQGNVDFALVNSSTGDDWRFQNFNGAFRITRVGTGVGELTVSGGGNLTITGEIFTNGSCSAGCDLVFSDSYELESIEEHAALMWTNRHLPAVGPTPENGTINLSQKTTGMLNELEKAHIYIEQLNERLEDKEAKLSELRVENSALEARLSKIETMLEDLALPENR